MSPPAEPRPPTLRTFVAIELGDPARAAVAEYLATLRPTPGVAWTRPENLHVTLKFLGDVATARISELSARLAAATADVPAFTMTVAGVGAFPNVARPRVLWVGCKAPTLPALAAAVDGACVGAGFAAEARAFHPHATLGRVREGKRGGLSFLAGDGGREFGASLASGIVLFASMLGRGGARYAPLGTFPLAAR